MARYSPWPNDAEALTLLAIGDVHLGTRPSSLPEDLDSGVDRRELTPEAALGGAVEIALEERVDAVLLAGDVVESTNARFEALRPLETAVRRLLGAGIRVLGVVGNHDVEALPRLAALIEGFELVGTGGQWEARLLEKAGRPAAEILGWSFPERKVRSSPVDQWLRRPLQPSRPEIPRIGLLHADLDASNSDYAPITTRELRESGLDAWLLGHIHKPSLPVRRTDSDSSAGNLFGYLGSLVGLDPSEQGAHGPWLVRVEPSGEVRTHHIASAPLRWGTFEFRVGEDEDVEDVRDRLLAEVPRVVEEIEQTDRLTPRVLGLRPRLVGATRHYDALRRYALEGRCRESSRWVGETLVFLDKVLDHLELAHDLEGLARGDDPPALLARQLRILAEPGEARSALIQEARKVLRGVVDDPRWTLLHDPAMRDASDPLSDEAIRTLLSRSATAALDRLLAQRHAANGADA